MESVENQVEPTIEEEVDKEKSSKAGFINLQSAYFLANVVHTYYLVKKFCVSSLNHDTSSETGKSDSDEESDVDGDGEEVESASEEDNEIQDEDEPENPLLIKTDEETVDKTNLWFSKV